MNSPRLPPRFSLVLVSGKIVPRRILRSLDISVIGRAKRFLWIRSNLCRSDPKKSRPLLSPSPTLVSSRLDSCHHALPSITFSSALCFGVVTLESIGWSLQTMVRRSEARSGKPFVQRMTSLEVQLPWKLIFK